MFARTPVLLAALLGALPSLVCGQGNLPVVAAPIPALSFPVGFNATGFSLAPHFALDGVNPEVNRLVRFETNQGSFDVFLANRTAAPATVDNFLRYVTDGRYANTIIHRSVPNFVIQGGGYTAGGSGLNAFIPSQSIERLSPIVLEYNLPNIRGSLSMARTTELNSATSEFFINLVDNTTNLGPGNAGGYAVFGYVLGTGMQVVDAIAAINRFNAGSPFSEIPLPGYPLPVPNPPPPVALSNLVVVSSVRTIGLVPEGPVAGALSFTATSSNPAVVAAEIEGARLRLTRPGAQAGAAAITVTARDVRGSNVSRTFDVFVETPASAARLVNLSTRAAVGTGGDIIISGFVIGGSGSKRLLIRGVGPTLTTFGVDGALADPRLVLSNQAGEDLQSVDNWSAAAVEPEVYGLAAGAFALPAGSRDAAFVANLAPGAYTVRLSGVGDTTGNGLIEVYDIDAAAGNARLVNLSSRAVVGTGAAVLIPGLVVSGSAGERTYLVRAIGPGLERFGVAGRLANPELRIVGANQATLASNDNWSSAGNAAQIAAVAQQVGAFPLDAGSADAAALVTLPPGVYSVVVSGVGGTSGVALVELYEVP